SLSTQSTSGYLENLLAIPTLDVSAEWFDQKIISNISYNNTLYYLTGASDSAMYQAVFLPIIGVTNVQGALGFSTPRQAADYLYDLILDGKWTIQKELELVTACYAAYNGTNVNHYGVVAEAHTNLQHMIGAGFRDWYRDGELVKLYDTFAECPNAAAWEALKPLLAPSDPQVNRRYIGTNNWVLSGTKSQSVVHSIGSTCYAYSDAMRSASNYAVPLPYPKMNESDEYRTPPNLGFAYAYTIPVTQRYATDSNVLGFENGTELSGYFLAAFFEASLNHTGKDYSVREAYIRQLAAVPAFHNTEFGGRPLETLQMIFSHYYLDPGYLLATTMYTKFTSCGNNLDYGDASSTLAGAYGGKWEQIADSYASSIDTYKNSVLYSQEFLSLGLR
ncbi:MAG: hypothetical protein II776_04075, partial [Clostridia bacterium]|nr:hypothetical protein [Clostridia bacterium]